MVINKINWRFVFGAMICNGGFIMEGISIANNMGWLTDLTFWIIGMIGICLMIPNKDSKRSE